MTIRVTIDQQNFKAALAPNSAAKAFLDFLPVTLDMSELNGNEKYGDWPVQLPMKASCPGKIEAGDLMLYGDQTIVIFYRSFATQYSYTRLGRIENSSALPSLLGRGSVKVSFAFDG